MPREESLFFPLSVQLLEEVKNSYLQSNSRNFRGQLIKHMTVVASVEEGEEGLEMRDPTGRMPLPNRQNCDQLGIIPGKVYSLTLEFNPFNEIGLKILKKKEVPPERVHVHQQAVSEALIAVSIGQVRGLKAEEREIQKKAERQENERQQYFEVDGAARQLGEFTCEEMSKETNMEERVITGILDQLSEEGKVINTGERFLYLAMENE